MDFQTLTRRELQSLCKRNKIPANTTNVAMAEALKSLDLVEGIGEITQQSQSGTAQSSTCSLEMAEVSSPFVPPTGGKSTRRTNIPKPAAESVNPKTRTRRTARKAQVKDADAIETPAPMTQANRKKGQTSACLNMNSQLNECADEDDDDDYMVTPAQLGATSRRRRAEESGATRVYSTRRSVRLAQKSKVETSTETESEESQGFKKDTAANDGVDSFNELSEITDESEVVSTGKEESEVVSEQKNSATIGEHNKMGSYAEEEAKLGEEKCVDEEDKTLNVSNEVQGNDGSQDVPISEIEITVEKGTEELKPEEGESSQDEAAKFVDEVILDSGDNFVDDCNTGFHDDTIMEGGSKGVTELNGALTELTLQQATKEADSEFVDRLDILVQHNKNEANKVESLQREELEKTAAADEACTVFSEQIPKSGLEPTETKNLHLEENEKSTKLVPSEEQYLDFSDQIPNSGVDVKVLLDSRNPAAAAADPVHLDEMDANSSGQTKGFDLGGSENEPTEKEVLHLKDSEKSAKTVRVTSDEQYADLSEQTLGSDLGGSENEPTETDSDFSEQTFGSDHGGLENEATETEDGTDSEGSDLGGLENELTETEDGTDSEGSDLGGLENDPTETEVLHLKDSQKSAKTVTVASDEQYTDFSKQPLGSELGGLENEATEIEDDSDADFSDLGGLENEPTETGVLHFKDSEKSAKTVTSDEQYADFSGQILKSGVDVEGSLYSCEIVQPTCLTPCKISDSMMMKMTDFSENIESGTELVVMGDDDDVKMSEKDVADMRSGLEGFENVPNETEVLHLEESELVGKPVASYEQNDDLSEQILKSGVDVEGSIDSLNIIKPARLTPSKNPDSMTTMTDLSQNTESGTELVVMRDDDEKIKKSVDDFHRLSMRQLTKMLKDKLEITHKPNKNEHAEATERTALQVISENQLVEESQN